MPEKRSGQRREGEVAMLDFIATIDPRTFWVCALPVVAALAVAGLWLLCRACDKGLPEYTKEPACNYRHCIAGSMLGDGTRCIMEGGEPWNVSCPKFEPTIGE